MGQPTLPSTFAETTGAPATLGSLEETLLVTTQAQAQEERRPARLPLPIEALILPDAGMARADGSVAHRGVDGGAAGG